MKKLTYRDLKNKMEKWNDQQLDSDVTIKTPDEEYFMAKLSFEKEDDVLDKGHPYLESLFENDIN